MVNFKEELMVNGSLAIDFTIPLDTKIRTNFKNFINVNLPIKADIPVTQKIPIHQPLQVNDTLILSMQDYEIPLRTTIPVSAKVPIKQLVKIEGELLVPVDQEISISLNKIISAPVMQPFTADVNTLNELATQFNSNLQINATFSQPLKVEKMDSLRIDPSKVKFKLK